MQAHMMICLWRRIETTIKENFQITEQEFTDNIYGKIEFQTQSQKLVGVGGFVQINNFFKFELLNSFFYFSLFLTLAYMIHYKNF